MGKLFGFCLEELFGFWLEENLRYCFVDCALVDG